MRIFISYRRSDTRHPAGRLSEHLEARFGPRSVFMDVDSIEPGQDFAQTVVDEVSSCDVLLVMIGEHWLDEQGRRRLHDPHDIVALEITTALERDIRLIPVLVDGAAPPRAGDLPAPLAPLAGRHAVRLDHAAFKAGVAELVAALDRRPEAAKPQGPHIRPLGELPGRVGPVAGLAFSPDGGHVVACGAEGVQIWDVATGFAVSSPGRVFGAVCGVAFSPDARLLAVCAPTAKVSLWGRATGRSDALKGTPMAKGPLAFSPDGEFLAAGGSPWTSSGGTMVHRPQTPNRASHVGAVTGLAFSPDGALYGSAGVDGAVRVWDTAERSCLHVMRGHAGPVASVAFSAEGSLVVSVGADATVRSWDPATGQPLHVLDGRTDQAPVAELSPYGPLLATGGTDGVVRMWQWSAG